MVLPRRRLAQPGRLDLSRRRRMVIQYRCTCSWSTTLTCTDPNQTHKRLEAGPCPPLSFGRGAPACAPLGQTHRSAPTPVPSPALFFSRLLADDPEKSHMKRV